jgi:hypothetical protein
MIILYYILAAIFTIYIALGIVFWRGELQCRHDSLTLVKHYKLFFAIVFGWIGFILLKD